MPNARVDHPASSPALVWLRQDLRLIDHPALTAAVASGRPVACLFVLDDDTPGRWRLGSASRWWLHHSLTAFAKRLGDLGGSLLLRRGNAADVVPDVARALAAAEVHWTRQYEPYAVARDTGLKQALRAQGLTVESHPGALAFEPFELKAKGGGPFKVYSPFARAARARGLDRAAVPAPARIPAANTQPWSDALKDWSLLPTTPDWAGGLRAAWRPGEDGAQARLTAFLEKPIVRYAQDRNTPDGETTSRLSPHLHFGELGPVQAWAAAEALADSAPKSAKGAEKFLSEILWREFSHHLLFHAPDLPERAWRASFEAFPWREDEAAFKAWSRGRTGYPIVDAGMRELWATGYMHNRVRMIAASFLIKHLLIDWRRGQDWFWDTLVDADLANNAASWQWVAGSGADAAPYFRIFNPVLQGETYDPEGAYVRRWVPELARLPNSLIHKPWTASPLVLQEAGIRLGETYPAPIVEHAVARARALAAFERIRAGADSV